MTTPLPKIHCDGLDEQQTADVSAILWALIKTYEETGFGEIVIAIRDQQIDQISVTTSIRPKKFPHPKIPRL